VTPPGYVEFDMCGGIGDCDGNSGQCFCHPGVEGVACSGIATAGSGSSTNSPLTSFGSANSDFRSDVVLMSVPYPGSSDFNFLRATENRNTVFKLTGAGLA